MRPVVEPVYDNDTVVNFRYPGRGYSGVADSTNGFEPGLQPFAFGKRKTGTRTTKVQCSGFVLLTTNAKLMYQRTVLFDVVTLEVFKQALALAHHHQEAAAG